MAEKVVPPKGGFSAIGSVELNSRCNMAFSLGHQTELTL